MINRKKTTFLLFLVLLIGFCLRVYNLGKHSFWYDETKSILETENLLTPIKYYCDVNPPLFGWILFFWKLLGENEFTLRLLPLLFGMVAIVMVYKLGKVLFNKKVGLVSAFLLAISPFHIYYSQELRSYTLITFLSLVSIYCLNESLKEKNSRYWISLVITNILCVYAHSIAVFLLAAENIYILIFYKKYKDLFRKWLVSQFIILLFCIPIVMIMSNRPIIGFLYWIPKPSLLMLMQLFNVFNLGYNADKIMYLGSFLIFFILFVYGIWAGKKEKGAIFLLTAWLFIPISLAMFISIILKESSIFLYRAFIFVLPAYLIILANGFSRMKKNMGYLILSFIILLTSLSLYNYYSDIFLVPFHPYVNEKKENKLAADYIRNNFKEGDGVAHTCRSTYGSFLFYHKKKLEEKWVISKYNKDWDPLSRVYYSFDASRKLLNLEPVSIAQFVRGKNRLWLVLSGWRFDYLESPDIKDWLDKNYILLEEKNFKGMSVYLYAVGS